ncbi:hypothetical protein GCM10007103_29060 [Salinimicrobium marinum]|uniref:Exopolysaccharide biosynthesis protein YbjH n=1 Tax=Salinimicrobium marinum TaxID=680283 RepID=A0A918SKT2_9FLAO|nr:YjbH domain-containing protein [Salinimicrobium marinum]GHA46160.1 hypothetical protein GCM10007103_29060 [Salinimicrobium marinum]
MRKVWINIIFYLAAGLLQAQELRQTLFDAGFENVQVKEQDDSLKVFFEHREFRNPYHSMRFANLLLQHSGFLEKPLVWIPLYHNTPIGSYTAGDFSFKELSANDRKFFRKENHFFRDYRFHLRVHPEVSARFGYYSHPFQTKFNLILDSRIYVAPGLSLQSGIAIPVENSLDNQSMKLRAAPSMLHYFAQPFNRHFIGLSLGSFYYDRYGVDFEYRYAPMEQAWSFGFQTSLTGFYWLHGTSVYSEQMNNLLAIADVEYRLPMENLSVQLSAGQFLFEDRGARLDLIKQFGTVDLGLHVASTEAGFSGGFQFAFSLWPGSFYRNKHVELRTTEEFRWEYSYNNEDPVARNFRLGMPRLPDLLRQYKEGFLKSL